jgi:hypothetical protein
MFDFFRDLWLFLTAPGLQCNIEASRAQSLHSNDGIGYLLTVPGRSSYINLGGTVLGGSFFH